MGQAWHEELTAMREGVMVEAQPPPWAHARRRVRAPPAWATISVDVVVPVDVVVGVSLNVNAASPLLLATRTLLLAMAACGASGETPAGTPDVEASDAEAADETTTPPTQDLDVTSGPPTDTDAPLDEEVADVEVIPLQVLFVGNSYTYFNDLPGVVRALGAATPGASVEVEAITQGGARLADHWSTTGARERIAEGGLDAVVLQGQSLEPVMSEEDFLHHAALFAEALSDVGARGVWFATWAREGAPSSMARLLEERYETAAELNGDAVAHVGAAWQIAQAELPDVALYTDDGSHPTEAGTLLAACVILWVLTEQAPQLPDPPPLGLPQETAAALCAIAPRARCAEGAGFCEGRCVDTLWNPEHCGDCDVVCLESDPCRQGVCGCDPGRTGCSRSCVGLLTSTSHCGECGSACSIGGVCENGSCHCPRASRQEVTIEQLAALYPDCDSWDDAGTAECHSAAHAHCEALECFNSGFGPPSGHAPSPRAVMCVAGDVRSTTYTELQTLVPECDGIDERLGQSCSTAISRYCASTGAVSGVGPIETSGDNLSVTCVSGATVVGTTLEILGGHASRCVPDPVTCGVASWNFCESLGYPGGFGPVEVEGTDLDVVCLEP